MWVDYLVREVPQISQIFQTQGFGTGFLFWDLFFVIVAFLSVSPGCSVPSVLPRERKDDSCPHGNPVPLQSLNPGIHHLPGLVLAVGVTTVLFSKNAESVQRSPENLCHRAGEQTLWLPSPVLPLLGRSQHQGEHSLQGVQSSRGPMDHMGCSDSKERRS